jgi:hypothetical protein
VSFGGLAVALGAAVAMLVVVGALVLVGHRNHEPQPAAGVPAGTHSLLSELAVLRRPQTPADRRAPASVTRGPGVVHELTRLATTVKVPRAGEIRAYVVVRRLGANSSVFGTKHGSVPGVVVATTVSPTGQTAAIGTGWARSLARPFVVRQANGLDGSIVPDGVARAKWVFADAGPASELHQLITVYPTVRNNLALAPIARHQGLLSSITWYGAGGQVIQTFDAAAQRAQQARKAAQAIARSSKRRVAASLINTLAVLRARRRAGSPSLPSDMAAAMAEQGGYGLNVAQARFVTAGGHGFWLVPGTSGACLIGPTPSGLTGCNDVRAADSGGLAGGSAGPNWMMLEGIVPDGNPTVSVVLSNGQIKRVPVVDNVYSLTVHGKPIALIVRNSAGHLRRVRL